MQLRHLAGAAVGAAGAAAVGNRVLSRRVDPLGPPLERETGSYRWRGMDVAYTEGGDPEAPDALLLHDLHRAGTSREFNRLFERLAETYHVFAPDLPGFGRSDRPPMTYSATLYETFLQDFVESHTEEPIAIASGRSGAYLVGASPTIDLERLVLVCPTDRRSGRSPPGAGTVLRAPVVGPTTTNAMTSRRALNRHARQLLYDPGALSHDDRSYWWRTAHQPGARYPLASLIDGTIDATTGVGEALETVDTEAVLVWGRAATEPSLSTGRRIADRADVKLVVLDQARRVPHFEQSDAFLDVLADERSTLN